MPVGAGLDIKTRGARQSDMNNSSNDFAPVVEVDGTYLMWKYSNNGSAIVTVMCNVTDEDNDTTEGAAIATVTVESSELGITSTALAYDLDGSMAAGGFNTTDQEGYWWINLTIPTNPADMYNLTVTATDDGTIPMAHTNSTNFTIRLYQENRAPRVRTALEGGQFTYTLDEDDFWLYFYVNETVFIDDDIENQPFPYTDEDEFVDYEVWDPDWEMWDTFAWFDNFTVSINQMIMPGGAERPKWLGGGFDCPGGVADWLSGGPMHRKVKTKV